MDLAWLRAFAAVAEEQHLRQAAHRLALTPGAVSKQIRKLERETRVRLFDRTPGGFTLTAAGADALAAAHRLLSDWDATLAGLTARSRAAPVGRRPLVLGIDDFGAGGSTIPLLTALRAAASRQLEIRQLPEQQQFACLADGEVDLVLGGLLHVDPRLDARVLAEQDRGLFLPPRSPLTEPETLTLDQVLDWPLARFRPDMPPAWTRYWQLENDRGGPAPGPAPPLVHDHLSLMLAVGLDGYAVPANATLGGRLASPSVVFRPLPDLAPAPVSLAWRAGRRDLQDLADAAQQAMRSLTSLPGQPLRLPSHRPSHRNKASTQGDRLPGEAF